MTQQNAPTKCPKCDVDLWRRSVNMMCEMYCPLCGYIPDDWPAAPPEGETMTFTDRKHLYRIDDGNGDPLFVQAETFAEAVAKFQKWDGDDDESNYQSVAYMGDIIDESKTRE